MNHRLCSLLAAAALALPLTALPALAGEHGSDHGARHGPPNAEQLTEHMSRGLDLSDEQRARVAEINARHLEQARALRDSDQDRDARRKAFMALREQHNADLREVLNEQQYQKHLEMQRKHEERMRERHEKRRDSE